MNCVFCGGKTQVKDTANHGKDVYRKRICEQCGAIFFTAEKVVPQREVAKQIIETRYAEYRADEKHKRSKHEYNKQYYERTKEKV